MQKLRHRLHHDKQPIPFMLSALVLLAALMLPILATSRVFAAGQLTERSLTISTGVPSASATWTFSFKAATSSPIQSLKLQACQEALGSCTAPDTDVFASASYGSISGWTNNGSAFTENAGSNDCTASNNVMCFTRSQGATEGTATAKSLVVNAATNPDTVNTTWFVRITTYSDTAYTVGNIVDEGTVASSTSQTLTINAAVQEVLVFCIGSTAVDDATTSVGASCTAVTGTSVNLGTLDTGTVSVTPVSTVNGGSNTNGVAMLRTNAVNGATISYKAVQQTGTNHQGTLRVSGATCSGSASNTDQCIDAQGSTQGTFTAGTEKFGMTVAGVNCGATTSYSCAFASNTNNLKQSAQYIGTTGNSYGTTNGFAWVEGGTATQIAASTTVVDYEALIIKFAATPAITTPTGSYTAQADFIAVATY